MITRGIASWARVTTPDQKYNCWNITLEVSKEEAEKLKAVGLKVKVEEKDDALVRTWRCSRYQKKRGKGGGTNPAPTVVDSQLNTFTGLIGNGSEVLVMHKPYSWNNEFGKGVGSDLQGVQIINLVEYVPEDDGEDVSVPDSASSDEGFSVIPTGFAVTDEEPKAPSAKEETKKTDDFDF